MKISKYQKNVKDLANYTPIQPMGLLGTIWLVEEASECLKCYKHALKDGVPVDLDALKEELGDTLTNIANICQECDFDMKDIAKASLNKLKERMKNVKEEEEYN